VDPTFESQFAQNTDKKRADDHNVYPISTSYGNAARHMLAKTIITEGHPEDNPVARMAKLLARGQLPPRGQEKLWRILVWRFSRDAWAEAIVKVFCSNIPPISTWTGDFESDEGEILFASVLSEVNQDPPPYLPAASYSRPLRYIRAAAWESGITPNQLRACIFNLETATQVHPDDQG